MHSRSGMATEYLSEDFMKLVKFCCDKAKKEDMLAWLYDEDRFPSGVAGGFVTKTIKYRMRHLIFTEKKMENSGSRDEGYENGVPYLLACYDIILDKNNKLADYRVIGENDTAECRKRYAYITTGQPSGWFNNQTYIDTMNPEAVDEFIQITHEEYKKMWVMNLGNQSRRYLRTNRVKMFWWILTAVTMRQWHGHTVLKINSEKNMVKI